MLVGDEYVVLIDDAMVPTVDALLDAVTDIAGRPVDYVFITQRWPSGGVREKAQFSFPGRQ